jgi:hypothetical protein
VVCGGRGFSWVVSEGGGKSRETTIVVWRCLSGGGRIGIRVSLVEWSGQWGELGRERELLRLLRLLVLVVGRLWRGDVEDVVAILLLLLLLRGSLRCIWGVG